jgi:hypothetical protein
MLLQLVAVAVVFAAAACRWGAYRSRLAPPRQFDVGQRGWWFPPVAAHAEFGTEAARRLELVGRRLVAAGVIIQLLALFSPFD